MYQSPEYLAPTQHLNPAEALEQILQRYTTHTQFLREALQSYALGHEPKQPYRAFYPYVRLITRSPAVVDSAKAFGFIEGPPGRYETTLTRPDLFIRYYAEQLALLRAHHPESALEVGSSHQPIPVHFAFGENDHIEGQMDFTRQQRMRLLFDLPDLNAMDDGIANGTWQPAAGEALPLSLFTGPRVDYSLQRLRHYCGTAPEHFQGFVLFTNYGFYVDEFIRLGRAAMQDPDSPYTAFVEPGSVTRQGEGWQTPQDAPRQPQMPAYHLVRDDGQGITMVNIGVGPANAKTITDHIAVLRPHAWVMLGHCAGLRSSQQLGDYVLAHAYVREDHVLDEELPLWVPVPALAEIQLALEQAVADVTQMEGADLKRIMRTGTVASTDNRNWELLPDQGPQRRFSQSRAIALDMESATVAANGFRLRVPYGTLLCVSDRPLHGEIKLPGMAHHFYRERVDQHLRIGMRALELLRSSGIERLHSRKLRSFTEVAFR